LTSGPSVVDVAVHGVTEVVAWRLPPTSRSNVYPVAVGVEVAVQVSEADGIRAGFRATVCATQLLAVEPLTGAAVRSPVAPVPAKSS
jgi:hypothetical protein